MNLSELKPFFKEDILFSISEQEQLKYFYNNFRIDFVDNAFSINGKSIKLFMNQCKIERYRDYPESYIHFVTRETVNFRIYDSRRANRIHWIKPILTSHPHRDILFFKWPDERGICKEHYWLMCKGFMVVTKELPNNVLIVTGFCVDQSDKLKYFERYTIFTEGKGPC